MREEFVLPIEYHSIHEIHVHVCIIVPYSIKFSKAINLMNFAVSLQNEWAAIVMWLHVHVNYACSLQILFSTKAKFSLIRKIYISRKFLLYSMYNIQCSAYDGWR